MPCNSQGAPQGQGFFLFSFVHVFFLWFQEADFPSFPFFLISWFNTIQILWTFDFSL